MAGHAQGLSIAPAASAANALQLLRQVEPHSDGTAEEMAADALLLDLRQGGRTVGAVALELGPVATIKAAATVRGTQGAWLFLPGLEAIARRAGAAALAAYTRRPGMVRMMRARGYAAIPCGDGYTELMRGL